MIPPNITPLPALESESIHILREVVAQCENPVMLDSIGKDSAVKLHIAMRALGCCPLTKKRESYF